MQAESSYPRILIVDDDRAVLRVLARLLRSRGFASVHLASDVDAALTEWTECPPDLALVDLHMPGTSGLRLLEQSRRAEEHGDFRPVIMITGDASPEARRRALDLGASDFLTKPFDSAEVLLRVRNLLRTRLLTVRLQDAKAVLEARVRERTMKLEEARREALEQLGRAAEFRDDVTGQHTRRVGELSASIAVELGWDPEAVEVLRAAAPLHDVGKIGIPDAILLKVGPLTAEEYAVMQTHTTVGAAILSASRSPVFELAREIALTHHERWDGSGYPHRLAGESIPMAGRIVCAADAYDALCNERPYKRASSPPEALAEIRTWRGRQFDPLVADALESYLASRSIADPASALPAT